MLKNREHEEAKPNLGKDPALLGSVFEMKGMPPMGKYHPAIWPASLMLPLPMAILTFDCHFCMSVEKKN